ncbi:hypothetical protein NNO_1326 [Hydrogenimonas sp.]|nr:hypothetical protein NNO_1326 [Hydrogenimonas sp.]
MKFLPEAVTLLLLSSLIASAAMVQSLDTDYLEGYLNEGMAQKSRFRCNIESSNTYRCEMKNFRDESDGSLYTVGEFELFFDREGVSPILDGAMYEAYLKNEEKAALIEKEMENIDFENGRQRAMQKKRLENRYLYDPALQRHILMTLFESLNDARAKRLELYDRTSGVKYGAELLEYHNGMKKSRNGVVFSKRVLGKMSLKMKNFYVDNRSGINKDSNRSLVVWQGLRRMTPAEVPMLEMAKLKYILNKSPLFYESRKSHGDGIVEIVDRAQNSDTLMSTTKMEFDESGRSESRAVLQFRIDHAKALLDDDSQSGTAQKPDVALISFQSTTELKPLYLQKYRSMLKYDLQLAQSTEALAEYIGNLTAYYRKRSSNRRFRNFLDSADRSLGRWLKGESGTISFRLVNESGSAFTPLVGGFFSRMMQKRPESYPNQNLIEFIFDNFSIEFGND